MKRIILSTVVVLALISIDASFSVVHAKGKITIFKVTKVTAKSKLKLRAWPSPSSRVNVSLPRNAKDLLETGKYKRLGKTKWVQVTWQNKKGWINARYLKKTGVLTNYKKPAAATIASNNSRNKSKRNTAIARGNARQNAQRIEASETDAAPQMPTENRYYQPTQIAATEVRTTYMPNGKRNSADKTIAKKLGRKTLRCTGQSPQPWNIILNTKNENMKISVRNGQSFKLPINYFDQASPNEVRFNIGGNKGRNIVDVNVEKTGACSTGLSRKNYLYEVNATINSNFYSGCCETVSH